MGSTPSTVHDRPRGRRASAQVALFGIAFVPLPGNVFSHPLDDFVEYWTTARLLVAHTNPYSIAEVSRLEHSLDFEPSMPLMQLSPPWDLALVVPLRLTQIMPWFLGSIWFVTYCRKHNSSWSWREHLRVLLTASVLTSTCGWPFDETQLVLPMICLAGNAVSNASVL